MTDKRSNSKIPKINADFFEIPDDGGVLAGAIERGEEAINKLARQDLPESSTEKDSGKDKEVTEIVETPQITNQGNQNSNFKKLEEFLTSGQDRKDTIPVRITRRNYNRLMAVKKHIGGSRSIPQSIDYILDVYLAEVEKYMDIQE